MSIYNDLYNSGQSFLYVFISPKAQLTTSIMNKRVQQIARLNEMYAADKKYTPAQMIEILRAGIQAKYGKSPELILQIIFDNAVRIDTKIGAVPLTSAALTFDAETNQWYDGSGNAYILDKAGAVVTKNGKTTDLTIETPATLDDVKVGKSSGGTFWDDVASVIEWIVGIFKTLGITKDTATVSASSPVTTDWAKLSANSSISSAGIGDYLPYIIGASIVYYLYTGTGKKSTKTKQK